MPSILPANACARSRRLRWLVAAVLVLCACAGTEDPVVTALTEHCPAVPPEVRFDHLQMLGTHASYHVAQAVPRSKRWAATHAPLRLQLEDQGVRAFELDLHYDAANRSFLVANRPGIDEGTTCASLGACLQQLRTWSDAHPCHHALFLLLRTGDDLDPVDVADHLPELDAALLQVWPRDRLLAPDDVRGTDTHLRAAVTTRGWPAVSATRARLLVALAPEPGLTQAYRQLHPGLVGAPAFLSGLPADDVVVVSQPVLQAAAVAGFLQQGLLVHAYAPPTQADGAAALASGAHVVTTDAPVPRAWLGNYSLTLPGGAPSRCNPVTAPATCTVAGVNGLGQ